MIGFEEIFGALERQAENVAADARVLGDLRAAAHASAVGHGVEPQALARAAAVYASVGTGTMPQSEAEAMAFVGGFLTAAELFRVRAEA